MKNKNNISYTGAYINLTKEEKEKYINDILKHLKENKIGNKIFKELNMKSKWDMVFHHLTINLGEIKNKEELGNSHLLMATSIGMIDNDEGKAIALKVSNMSNVSEIKVPHITLMVGKDGGKPFDSNKIVDWVDFKTPFIFNSVIEEFEYGSKVPKKRVDDMAKIKKQKYYEEYVSGIDSIEM